MIFLATFFGILKKDRKYRGNEAKAEFIQHTILTKESCLFFHKGNFLVNLVIISTHALLFFFGWLQLRSVNIKKVLSASYNSIALHIFQP